MKDYESIFSERGGRYHRAMQHFPDARRQEFEQMVSRVELSPGMVVADVPAGGGYLLPLPLPWSDESDDAAMKWSLMTILEEKQ